ncbi:MAG: Integrase catalytic region [Parcubacteria group bacterium GW2011_GWD2_40_9]|nr:MAG: Integrase catalytic region [Parcubacteria group bacterium GW2011_GWD2_40_9]
MTMDTKKELFGIELQVYLNASKKKKGEILDSLSRQTGMWRESIMRSFKRLQMKSVYIPKKKRGRSVYYTPDVYAGLKEVWKAANSCCGELLHPVISEYVLIFKRDKTWKHGDVATGKLLAMSRATIKRKVNGWQCESGRKGISTTTPSAIKERVPIFQGSWYEVSSGMGQIDTVAHCGGSLSGDFIYSCGYVDVSCWFHYTAQWNKGMEVTKESLKHIQKQLPFPLEHIHPDCGMEFLNQIVMKWCEDEKIEVSRSRSYHKNDNGYIEQRNGHIARRWLGYDRLGNKELLPRIIKFYDLVCEYHNHFIAQRLRIGTKLLPNGKHHKVYEKNGMTPFTRLFTNEKISKEIKEKLKTEHDKLNPKILHDKLLKIKYDILQTNRHTTERS